MRLFFTPRTKGRIEFGIIYGGIALLALGVARFLPVLPFIPSCLFHDLVGLPCPTCGISRSIVHLAHGNIASSFFMNPLAALCMTAAVLYFFYSLVSLLLSSPVLNIQLTDQEKNVMRAGAIVPILVNWFYLMILF